MAQTININESQVIQSNYDPAAKDEYLHSDKFKQWLVSQGYNRELVDKYPEEYYYIDWYLSHHSFIYDFNHALEETLWYFYNELGCNENVIVDYFITDWPNEKPSYIKKTLKNLKTKGQHFYYKQLDPQDIDDILGWNYIKNFAAYFDKKAKEHIDHVYNLEHSEYTEWFCKILNDIFETELYKAGLHDLYYSDIKCLDILKERTFTLEYNPIAVINQNNDLTNYVLLFNMLNLKSYKGWAELIRAEGEQSTWCDDMLGEIQYFARAYDLDYAKFREAISPSFLFYVTYFEEHPDVEVLGVVDKEASDKIQKAFSEIWEEEPIPSENRTPLAYPLDLSDVLDSDIL